MCTPALSTETKFQPGISRMQFSYFPSIFFIGYRRTASVRSLASRLRNTTSSTQNQALNALLFLYRDVLRKEIGYVDGVIRVHRSGNRRKTQTSPARIRVAESCETSRSRGRDIQAGNPLAVALLSSKIAFGLRIWAPCDYNVSPEA